MKKLLAMCLVLAMASVANAAIMEVIAETGSLGHAGTSADPLEAGEVVLFKIALVDNGISSTYAGYPSYHGYVLSSMDIKLAVSNGVFAKKGAGGAGAMKHNSGFSLFDIGAGITTTGIDRIQATSSVGINVVTYPGYEDGDLIWNVKVTVPAIPTGDIVIGLSLTDGFLTQYATQHKTAAYLPGDFFSATNSDLAGLTLSVVPEPITMSLLGLGGLALIRRRRKA